MVSTSHLVEKLRTKVLKIASIEIGVSFVVFRNVFHSACPEIGCFIMFHLKHDAACDFKHISSGQAL